MGITTVFSWKVSDEKYGYLWTVETEGPCITYRITDPSKLEQIVGEVSSWDESTYAEKFNALSDLIHRNFGQYIEGSYSDYYHGNNGGKSYIMLTGKDGSGAGNSGNSDIDEDVLEKIKTFITKEVSAATVSVKTELNNFKASTTEKMNVFSGAVETKINSTKNELTASTNSIIDGRLGAISNNLKDSVLGELKGEIPGGGSLSDFVNTTNIMVGELTSNVNGSIARNSNLVEEIGRNVSEQSTRIESINRTMEDEIQATNNKIDNLANDVNVINTKVDRVAASHSMSEETVVETENFSASKGENFDEDSYILETETIDNDDGTFDIISRIGNEEYDVKILSFGNKLKVGDSNVGLTLASNGFKYLDRSGSSISIINGNILLSNADGSGKLEIKKDGLYINGVKQ